MKTCGVEMMSGAPPLVQGWTTNRAIGRVATGVSVDRARAIEDAAVASTPVVELHGVGLCLFDNEAGNSKCASQRTRNKLQLHGSCPLKPLGTLSLKGLCVKVEFYL